MVQPEGLQANRTPLPSQLPSQDEGKVKIALPPLAGSANLQPFCDVVDGDRERTRKLMEPVRVSSPVRTIGSAGEVVRPHALVRPTRSVATSGTIKRRP